MKRAMGTIAVICMAGAMLTGCASSPKKSETTKEIDKQMASDKIVVSKEQEIVILNWKNRGFGKELPSWLDSALDGDFTEFKKTYDCKGKTVLLVQSEGEDLELAESWLANFEFSGSIARTINTAVDARFGGVLTGDEKSQSELVATASKARFSGFLKQADTWVQMRVIDNRTNSYTDKYSVIQVYTIDPSDYNQLIKTYLRQLGSNLDTEKAKKVQTMADDLSAELSGKDVSTGNNE
jgi:hypothetical protein